MLGKTKFYSMLKLHTYFYYSYGFYVLKSIVFVNVHVLDFVIYLPNILPMDCFESMDGISVFWVKKVEVRVLQENVCRPKCCMFYL